MYGRFKDVMYDWYNTNCAVDSNAAILCGIINTDCGLLSFQIGEFQINRIL